MLLQNSSKARWYCIFFFGIQSNKKAPSFLFAQFSSYAGHEIALGHYSSTMSPPERTEWREGGLGIPSPFLLTNLHQI